MNDPAEKSERQLLAEYQAKVLDILHQAKSPDAAHALICELSERTLNVTPHSMSRQMVDVAMQLTRKWGVPKAQ